MKTALVIEDNEDNLVLITKLLGNAGYGVIAAETGQQGYERAVKEKPDFILLDIQLPDMDGTAVLRMIRAEESLKDIVVIAVTSYAMAGDRERLLAAGCNGYVEKPIDPLQIIPQLERILCT